MKIPTIWEQANPSSKKRKKSPPPVGNCWHPAGSSHTTAFRSPPLFFDHSEIRRFPENSGRNWKLFSMLLESLQSQCGWMRALDESVESSEITQCFGRRDSDIKPKRISAS